MPNWSKTIHIGVYIESGIMIMKVIRSADRPIGGYEKPLGDCIRIQELYQYTTNRNYK